jgi:ubiquinone biosynthesis protein COQ9
MAKDDPARRRDEILLAALAHAPFDGWTWTALKRGAAEAGYDDETAAHAFPGGPAGLAEHYSRYADRMMLAALDKLKPPATGTTERVGAAVRIRLEQAAPHREALRRLAGFLALPQNAALAARGLYGTVDAIWRAAGDTATDWSFYSKRASLSGVVAATVLYWLNDQSEDFADTNDFLDRRLADAARFAKATGRFSDSLARFTSPLKSMRASRRRA